MKTKERVMKAKQHYFVGIPEAAHMLGYDRFYVNVLLWRGRLKGTKGLGRWRIPLHKIRRYADKRRRVR